MKKFKGIKLNLQMFASDEFESFEDDDTILPDDFEDLYGDGTPADDELGSNDEGLLEGDETPAADGEEKPEGDEQQQLEAFLKIKYNGEEKGLSAEEAQMYAQMGMNYPKIQERLQALENDPRLHFVNELARENGFDNPNDFLEEFKTMQEQARIDELVQQNIPEEYAREMLENRKEREQRNAERQAEQQQQAEIKEYTDFFEAYRQANGKDFNPDSDKIPQEVLDIREQDQIPLQYAFMKFHNQQLQQQISVFKQNESNTKKAPLKGGVTKHGSGSDNLEVDDFLLGFDSY